MYDLNILAELNEIQRRLDTLRSQIYNEHVIMQQELEERLELGLTGNDAIEHFNNWMKRYDMNHLIIEI